MMMISDLPNKSLTNQLVSSASETKKIILSDIIVDDFLPEQSVTPTKIDGIIAVYPLLELK